MPTICKHSTNYNYWKRRYELRSSEHHSAFKHDFQAYQIKIQPGKDCQWQAADYQERGEQELHAELCAGSPQWGAGWNVHRAQGQGHQDSEAPGCPLAHDATQGSSLFFSDPNILLTTSDSSPPQRLKSTPLQWSTGLRICAGYSRTLLQELWSLSQVDAGGDQKVTWPLPSWDAMMFYSILHLIMDCYSRLCFKEVMFTWKDAIYLCTMQTKTFWRVFPCSSWWMVGKCTSSSLLLLSMRALGLLKAI